MKTIRTVLPVLLAAHLALPLASQAKEPPIRPLSSARRKAGHTESWKRRKVPAEYVSSKTDAKSMPGSTSVNVAERRQRGPAPK